MVRRSPLKRLLPFCSRSLKNASSGCTGRGSADERDASSGAIGYHIELVKQEPVDL